MAFGKKEKIPKESLKKIFPESGSITMLGVGTKVEGNFKLEGDARIDGCVVGNIEGRKRIVIGEKGKVVGDVVCEFLELYGNVKGNITCKNAVRLHAMSILEGDLYTPQFSVEMGATFLGVSKGKVATKENIEKK